jgi:DNA-binding response OmpR family regulator
LRILLIEDEPEMAAVLTTALTRDGAVVDHLATLGLAREALADPVHDAVLLDRRLPDGDGLILLAELRARGVTTPVLVLTALGDIADRVSGLDKGADDYLTKPFALEELMARLRSVLRRPALAPSQTIRIGRLDFDLQHRAAGVAGRPLVLPRRERLVLEALIRRAGRAVSRERLEAAVYGFDEDVLPSAIDPHVSRLRRRLAEAGAGVEIRGIRGIGYLLRVVP